MQSIYIELALYGRKLECARTDNVFSPISEVCDGTRSLIIANLHNSITIWKLHFICQGSASHTNLQSKSHCKENKSLQDSKSLPLVHLIGCQGVLNKQLFVWNRFLFVFILEWSQFENMCLSQFEFLRYVPIWNVEFGHNLS